MMTKILVGAYRLLASYGFACVLFLLLALLTLLGTLEQHRAFTKKFS